MAQQLELVTADIVKENDLLRLVLGVCPALSVTTIAYDSLVIGGMVTVILVLSQFILSILLIKLPKSMAVPVFVSLEAGFVTILDLLTQAYYPAVYNSLGDYLPLMVINCLILGKISPHTPTAFADALKMGLGFTAMVGFLGICREVLGMGTFFGAYVLPESIKPFTAISAAPGGFLFFGFLLAFISLFSREKKLEESVSDEIEVKKTSQLKG